MRSPDHPWISVVMPVHDGAATLARTLDSLAAQPLDGVELIILDSSADDQCQRLVEQHSVASRISLSVRRDLPGWQAKTNAAVAIARAPWIAMLHQDDLWLPGCAEALRQQIFIAEQAGCVWSFRPTRLVDARDRSVGCWKLPVKPGVATGGQLAERLLTQNFVAVPSVVIQRAAWLACGGLDDQLWYTADWDLYLKLARHGPAYVAEDARTAFRIHATSLTMRGAQDQPAFRQQMECVLARHAPTDGSRHGVAGRRRALVSIDVNCGLAAAAQGQWAALARAFVSLAKLGPAGVVRYLHDSRLFDRLLPRVRLHMRRAL